MDGFVVTVGAFDADGLGDDTGVGSVEIEGMSLDGTLEIDGKSVGWIVV